MNKKNKRTQWQRRTQIEISRKRNQYTIHVNGLGNCLADVCFSSLSATSAAHSEYSDLVSSNVHYPYLYGPSISTYIHCHYQSLLLAHTHTYVNRPFAWLQTDKSIVCKWHFFSVSIYLPVIFHPNSPILAWGNIVHFTQIAQCSSYAYTTISAFRTYLVLRHRHCLAVHSVNFLSFMLLGCI